MAGRAASHDYAALTAYGYDAAGRLQAMGHDLAGTSRDQTYAFAYNPASQIVSRTGTNDAYAYAPPANVSRAYQVNGLNQYTSTGTATLGYDANGNLASDGSTSFVYDSENRLVAASGATGAALAYDPLGRLWRVTGVGGVTTRFLYDGDRLVMEYDGAGAVTRSYVHGPGVDEPLVAYESGQRRFLHADHQGSIVARADDSGNAVATAAYDPWGVPNTANPGRFGYTGQAWIPELGLYYYKARFYSARLGRFLQTDLIGYEGGINLYAYADNDPLNKTDPSGENPYCTNGHSCDSEVQQKPYSLNDTYSEAVDADSWSAAWASLKSGDYSGALGNTFKGVMAVVGLSPAGRSPKVVAVIGHYAVEGGKVAGYVGLAQKIGARFFQIPMPIWNKMTKTERWAANTRFLNRQIRDGAVFKLSHRAQDARPGSDFAREVEYLKSKGYKVSDDGLTMSK